MIDGFRLQFSSSELADHLKARIAFHNTRIEVISEMKTERHELDTPENRSKLHAAFELIRKVNASNSEEYPVDAGTSEQMVDKILSPARGEMDEHTRSRIEDHRKMIDLFSFYSSRLIPNEVYRLSLQEVIDLEIFGYSEGGPSFVRKGSIHAGQNIRGMEKLIGGPSREAKMPLREAPGALKPFGKTW